MKNKKNTNCCWCGAQLPAGIGEAFFVDDEMELCGIGPMGRTGWMAQCENRKECRERKVQANEEREKKLKEIAIIDAEEAKLFSSGQFREGKNSWPEGTEYARRGKGHNIYGGGECYVDTGTTIWHIKNNGMDGDNWARNNVITGGAGAIGHTYERTEKRIHFLQENCIDLTTKNKKEKKDEEFRIAAEQERVRNGLKIFFSRTGWTIERIDEELEKMGKKTFCPRELTINGTATVHLTSQAVRKLFNT